MATLTPILGLSKPIVGADDDIWGNMWNQNADIIDGLVKPVDLAPYLLKAGGTMTGPLTLSANAVNALHAVPFQQLNSGLATKIGDAPNDGGYYARRNLAWEPSPGSAINQDAPSDGFAYGRRNASWDKTLRLAGGVVAGATTINGNVFAATTGHLTAPGQPAMPADAIGAWWRPYEIALGVGSGHLAFNAYVGSGPAWKALDAGVGATMMLATTGNVNLTVFPSAAAGAVFNGGTGSFDFYNNGQFHASGDIIAGAWLSGTTGITSGANLYVNATLCINPTNSWEWSFYRDASNDQIQAHRSGYYQRWQSTGGNWIWVGNNVQALSLTPGGILTAAGYFNASGADANGYSFTSGAGGVWVSGSIYAGGNVTAASSVVGAWIHSTGGIQAETSVVAYGPVISYTGRIISQAGQANPGFCNHWPGVYANGMICDGYGALLFGQMDGNGGWVRTWASINTSMDFWVAGAVTSAYMHSTGSLQVDGDTVTNGNLTGGRVRATNGMMNVNGIFYVADNGAYRLERQAYNGVWVFFENEVWNFQVQPSGDCSTRGVSYAQHHFAYGNLYAGNAWDFIIGGGGAGRIMQFASNWYWDWNGSSGDMGWTGAGAGLFKQRQGDWLGWNQTGPIGGIGGYQNYSDARGKEDITHTEVGLPEVMRMKPARFKRIWKPELITGRKAPDGRPIPDLIPRSEIGFIAQELQEALPEAVVEVENVTGDGEARLMMTLDPIVAALVNAVKTLNGRLVKLEGRH